ncbi:SusD/RagB family nutrient-binding outer membrane lipoprotein [Bacteroides sp. 224]|uniref:SusD/RagB family nutrient-binding outer membrane lipoprotein n=1 Tax=Bacteroides sp. 224 TaxID=2302936 RepID=UPI0013D25981|nr:SusD/RagB family nutrient-binding outer membrane lipoprotein [Bacteroides sp. 224]NDV63794.1 SusD/RagB family nutrient-binding outer membrane lipoprotein [Bacteroides sp. 224]
MKPLLYTFAFLLLFTSCEKELDSRHFSPDKFKDANIEYLYTQGLTKTIDNDYNDFYNYVFRLLGTYTQTVARKSNDGRVSVYTIRTDNNRWNRYYVTRMQELVEMDKKYNFSLPEAQRVNYAPYMETAKILKAYNTIMTTDVMGSMPYSEAWGARNGLYGQPVNLTPKYDSQKDIYYSVLDDLESAATYLKNNSLNNDIEKHRIFPTQDVVYGGNYNKWYKFANSMRLRAAMRISNVDEAKAKEVLSKLTLDDLITQNADNPYTKVEKTALVGNRVGIWRALKESQSQTHGELAYAPQRMVNLFNDAEDPRLPVFFQPPTDLDGNVTHPDKPIVGYPESADDSEALVKSLTADEIRNTYGVVSSVTIRNNSKFPNGIGITASEVYLFLAEARLRNLITWGDVEEFYNKAIVLSVQEYYNYYKNSTETKMKVSEIANKDVSETALNTWIGSSIYKYDASKALEQIMTQKWIHLWIVQPFENWAELRRTDLPVMVEDKEKSVLLNRQNAPTKFMYPSTESTLNGANFNAVANENNPSVRVWWDKQ